MSTQEQNHFMTQTTNEAIMILPHTFFSNPQTASSNAYQTAAKPEPEDITDVAHEEFYTAVKTLKDNGILVHVFEGKAGCPDSIFPNNTFSTHANNTTVTYPLLADNRHEELSENLNNFLLEWWGAQHNLRDFRDNGEILEGTGSLVIDRANNVTYAVRSPRTTDGLTASWSKMMDQKLVSFDAVDHGQDIYHTNVVMSVSDNFAVLCTKSIPTESEQNLVTTSLKDTGHEIIDISIDQMNKFCGNVLQMRNDKNEKLVIMSTTAYEAFEPEQIAKIEDLGNKIVQLHIPNIEEHGGGSARCMIAEVFRPA